MWPNPQEKVDLVAFTEEILDGKLHFLWSVGPKYSTAHDLHSSSLNVQGIAKNQANPAFFLRELLRKILKKMRLGAKLP